MMAAFLLEEHRDQFLVFPGGDLLDQTKWRSDNRKAIIFSDLPAVPPSTQGMMATFFLEEHRDQFLVDGSDAFRGTAKGHRKSHRLRLTEMMAASQLQSGLASPSQVSQELSSVMERISEPPAAAAEHGPESASLNGSVRRPPPARLRSFSVSAMPTQPRQPLDENGFLGVMRCVWGGPFPFRPRPPSLPPPPP